jgi:hypothetical protein
MDENPYQPPRDQSPLSSDPEHRAPSIPLSAPNLFGVVVRSVGLLTLVYAVQAGLSGFAPAPGYAPHEYFMQGGVGVGLGMVLIFAADVIVRVVYGSARDKDSGSGNT